LIASWLDLHAKLEDDGIDPIMHAVISAFAFIYIHPLQDGNGRLHRFLLHHTLAQREFYPKGLIFPISTVILNDIESYREVLMDHSAPLMDYIQWESTQEKNVRVLNDTSDFYRYFDCTGACEYIFSCVEKTISEILPEELRYLGAHDRTFEDIHNAIEMPDNMIKNLITFVLNNNGRMPKRRREKEFAKLTDEEVTVLENIIMEHFEWKLEDD
jgi:hypothetical protein